MPQKLMGVSSNRIMGLIKQFSKFIIVGIINTSIDFAVLNIEILITGITSGPWLFLLNTISFSIAVINSYFMNKYWTFEDKRSDNETAVKFSQFLGVSVVGIGINGITIVAITSFISPVFNLSPQMWANIAKLFATGVSLVWNFIGYKLWVFKR